MEATNQLQHYLTTWNNRLRKLKIDKAADSERVKILEDLCRKGADLEYLEKERNFACIPHVYWSKKLIKFFVHKGLNINSQNQNGDTALHLVLQHPELYRNWLFEITPRYNVEVIKYLMNKISNYANFPKLRNLFALVKELDGATGSNYTLKIAEKCVKQGAGANLMWHDEKNRATFCASCSFIGENIEARTSKSLYSQTPLMMAADEGRWKCCQCLVEKLGADLSAQDLQGYTALHHAVSRQSFYRSLEDCANTAKVLVDLGADPYKKSGTGRNVYELAILNDVKFTYGANGSMLRRIVVLKMAKQLWEGAIYNVRLSQDPFNPPYPSEMHKQYFKLLLNEYQVDGGDGNNFKKFWSVLNVSATLLNNLIEPGVLERIEEFASLEQIDFKTLFEKSNNFRFWLESLITEDGPELILCSRYSINKNEFAESWTTWHFHSVAILGLACFNKVIEETQSKLLPHLIFDVYLAICKNLALMRKRFGDVMSETEALQQNDELLKKLIDLDLRRQNGDTLIHVVLNSVSEKIDLEVPYKFQDRLRDLEILDALLELGNVENIVKARNLNGLEPIQCMYFYEEQCLIDVMFKMADRGAHIDAMNAYNGPTLKEVFEGNKKGSSFRYDTLKCACARVLMGSVVPFRNRVPKSIVDFIMMHPIPKMPNLTESAPSAAEEYDELDEPLLMLL